MTRMIKYAKVVLTVVFCLSLSLLFVACGEKTKYTVTFDAGAEYSIESQQITEGKQATRPDDPERFGFKIVKWKNGGSEWDFSSPVTQNVTLVAEWKQFIYVEDGVITNCIPNEVPAELTIPGNVKTIGEEVFRSCNNLEKVIVSSGVVTVEDMAFFCCNNLKNVVLSDSVTTVGVSAFAMCGKLESVILSQSLTEISGALFDQCGNLTSITIPGGVTTIGNSAFYNCNKMTSLAIPAGVKNIGDGAFSTCTSLTTVTFDKNSQLAYIGINAFWSCSSMTSITIPASVTTVGRNAFRFCDKLTINCKALSQPSGWDATWNSYNCPVNWGV